MTPLTLLTVADDGRKCRHLHIRMSLAVITCRLQFIVGVYRLHKLNMADLVNATFYGLAVKTGSIALQKFSFFSFLFFFFGLRKKVSFLGSKYFFPDSLQKTNVTT